ncbi:MAG: hypothetical protein ACRYG7_43445 [Janthinobacterium lividum]
MPKLSYVLLGDDDSTTSFLNRKLLHLGFTNQAREALIGRISITPAGYQN